MNEQENDNVTNKPQAGFWDRPETSSIVFDVNIAVAVEFLTDRPEEIQSTKNDGVYYRFPVRIITTGEESVINSSAWTLLGELKKLGPLTGVKVSIVKKIVKGRQEFTVIKI